MHLFTLGLLLCVGACSDGNKPSNDTSNATVNEPSDSSIHIEDSSSQQYETGTPNTDDSVDDHTDECAERQEQILTWFTGDGVEMTGTVWFGHTHVTEAEDPRWAPKPVSFRDTLILFDSDIELAQDTDLRITAMRGSERLGVLQVNPPERLPTILEQDLTEEPLEPWSVNVWSVHVPWNWMEESVTLHIGYEDNGNLHEFTHTLSDLGAPHRFTVSRTKIVLFGDESFDTTTYSAQQLGLDFFSVLPISELHWVDSTNWVLDEIVVRGANGPVKVSNESERLTETSDPDRWGILKNIFTHRVNLANTGLGLRNTTFSGGNSPYSFGTVLGLGWVVDENGVYVDINNAPYSAGWTGWSSIWHGECGNVFNHEIGHSFTLEHFTEGTGNSWGIADQYPNDGVNLDTHPWGYDNTRRQFRTWYRVDENGVVYQNNGDIQGKRDSMNGGESSNALHCFPQYTGYHAWKIQNWVEGTPTFARSIGGADIVQWNPSTRRYDTQSSNNPSPVEVFTPVATIIGSLANTETSLEANHVYPPIFWSSGNLFALPDPTQSGLTNFEGANYIAEITTSDNQIHYALINQSTVTDTNLHLFSFNISLNENPVQVRLLHSESAYPNIDMSNLSELAVHSFEAPVELPQQSTIGRHTLNTGKISITNWCEEGVNCNQRSGELTWSDHEALSFQTNSSTPTLCSDDQSLLEFTVDAEHQNGTRDSITLRGQRIVESNGTEWTVAMNDSTSWSQHPNVRQSLKVWMPYESNQHLTPGTWRSDGHPIKVLSGSEHDAVKIGEASVDISVTIETMDIIDLNQIYESTSLTTIESSLYFVLTDPTVGPTTREWWGSNNYTPLSISMIDQDTGEPTIVTVNSAKQTCNLGWGTLWTINSGQIADTGCTYQIRLEMPNSGNEHLISGHTYRSPNSQPIIFEGRRWHSPNANNLVGRFVFQMEYTAP